MADKKEIGTAFKERLNELKESPNEQVWKNISTELNKKEKKKRRLFIWYKIGGVAAIIFLFSTVIMNVIYNPENKEKEIITDVKKNKEHHEFPKKGLSPNSTVITKKSKLVNSTNKNYKTVSKSKFTISTYKNKKTPIKSSIRTSNNTLVKSNSKITSSKKIMKISSIKLNNSHQKPIFNPNLTSNTELNKLTLTTPEINKKEKTEVTKKLDEELHTEKIKNQKQWHIALHGAPVFYSALSNGSSLDQQFANNSKNSNTTFTLGLTVGYSINKKLQLRTGLHQVKLSYTTNDILRNSVGTSNDQSFSNLSIDLSVLNEITSFPGENNNINFTQNITYYEVPFELKYKLLEKKIDINVISGFSTMLLNDNSIILNNTSNIGKAKNLKNISFTGNIGLGVNYPFNKYFTLNLEPMIKMQINPYKNKEDYQPYYFGIYTGVTYKF